MVFQSYALYPHMSVRDNMSYSLRLRKTAKEKIVSMVSRAAETLELSPLLERRPKALSGGQRQRVAMGRAIVRSPKAFLFDEPLSNLDARLREQMRAEIKTLHRDLGATSIYVTHDQIEAMTLADRIVAMHAGVIQQVGSPLDLYDRPANLFVAGFIGSPAMNTVKGRVRAGRLEFAGGSSLQLPLPAGAKDGAEIVLGVRPEHLKLAEPGEGLSAKVDLVEPTGFGTILHLAIFGAPMKAFTLDRSFAVPGKPVSVSIDPDKGASVRRGKRDAAGVRANRRLFDGVETQ